MKIAITAVKKHFHLIVKELFLSHSSSPSRNILFPRKLIVLLLFGVIPLLPSSAQSSDPELGGKLKAIMLMFDKNQATLKEEIVKLNATNSELSEANLKLYKELKEIQELVGKLEAENQQLRAKVSVRELESTSSKSFKNQQLAATQGNTKADSTNQSLAIEMASGEKLVNINTATIEELSKLPAIDEEMAAQIISNRPYQFIDDLIINQGFGPMKLRRITQLIIAQ
jgi:DNA uptake protein ComE-like DNA-binding protein